MKETSSVYRDFIRMGTRGSALALAQASAFALALESDIHGLRISKTTIRTTGDQRQGNPLPAIGGKGVFTLEIESALLSGEIDFAVHSLKDLPPDMPPGLCLAVVPRRESAANVCLLNSVLTESNGKDPTLSFLRRGARVGTSSLRRRAQLLHLRPDLEIADVRGNIDTRLEKLENGYYDAIVLAAAGVNRLNLTGYGESHAFDEKIFVPAPGQGALAIQAREDDAPLLQLLALQEDKATRAEITAERAAMRALGAGCTTPLGARAVCTGAELHLWAVVLGQDGKDRIFAERRGLTTNAESIGNEVAEELLRNGAGSLLNND